MSAHEVASGEKTGRGGGQGGGYVPSGREKSEGKEQDEAGDFAQDRTVLSLAAVRASLMEGVGHLSDDEIAGLILMLDRLAKQGMRAIPVEAGESAAAAIRRAHKVLEDQT